LSRSDPLFVWDPLRAKPVPIGVRLSFDVVPFILDLRHEYIITSLERPAGDHSPTGRSISAHVSAVVFFDRAFDHTLELTQGDEPVVKLSVQDADPLG
jgi:hypothetical protein